MSNKKYNKRINVLSKREIEEYFGKPNFIDKEREHYLSMSDIEVKLMKTLSSSTQWYFVLQLGYFKAKKQFFTIQLKDVLEDLKFIAEQHSCILPTAMVSEDTHRKIRKMILTHLDYQFDQNRLSTLLQEESAKLTCHTLEPKKLFEAFFQYTLKTRHTLPKYTRLQDIIGDAIKQESLRLKYIIEKHLPQYAVAALKEMLCTKEQYYEITLAKKDQKNFKHKEVMKTIERKGAQQRLYKVAQKLIPKLLITREMVIYYASLVNHYPVSSMRKLSDDKKHLYLLCYIFGRVHKLNDNIMNVLVFYVNRYEKDAKEYGEKCIRKACLDLRKDVKKNLPKVLQLFINKSVPDKEIREKGFTIIAENKFEGVINYISGKEIDEGSYRWKRYNEKKHEIIKNIRPIFCSLEFTCNDKCSSLGKAITFLKEHFNSQKSLSQTNIEEFPVMFIPGNIRSYIYKSDAHGSVSSIELAQYEYCVYAQIRRHFKNNDLAVKDSINYKSLADDLLPKHKRKSIIKKLGNPILLTPFKKALPDDRKQLDD